MSSCGTAASPSEADSICKPEKKDPGRYYYQPSLSAAAPEYSNECSSRFNSNLSDATGLHSQLSGGNNYDLYASRATSARPGNRLIRALTSSIVGSYLEGVSAAGRRRYRLLHSMTCPW